MACAMKANHCSGKGSAIAERTLDTAQEDQTTRRFTLAGYRRRKTAITNPLGKLQAVPQIATRAVVEQDQLDLICREMGSQATQVVPHHWPGQHQRVAHEVELHRQGCRHRSQHERRYKESSKERAHGPAVRPHP